jgi:hypothetical protein
MGITDSEYDGLVKQAWKLMKSKNNFFMDIPNKYYTNFDKFTSELFNHGYCTLDSKLGRRNYMPNDQICFHFINISRP